MLFSLLQSGIDTLATAAEAVPQQQEMIYSLISLAAKGGWLMIILLILSILAIYIFGSRWWMIYKAGKNDPHFMDEIRSLIHDGKIRSAVELCRKQDSPVARLVEKGIERIGRPPRALPDAEECISFSRVE